MEKEAGVWGQIMSCFLLARSEVLLVGHRGGSIPQLEMWNWKSGKRLGLKQQFQETKTWH